MARVLTAAPHVAGTPGQAAVRDTLVAWLGRWGLEPEVETYEVFLPHPRAVEVALVEPESIAFELREEPLPDDPVTNEPQHPWVNGFSGAGSAEAPVVYAHYGLHTDYARLDSLGVEVAGRIVIARYGRAYRGVKAGLAEERGAAALVLYSDPDDDGYVQGDVYPEGPWRPWSGVQRGSVLNGAGDPGTPDGPSLTGAPRTTGAGLAAAVPGIPVVPVSYGVAGEILSRLRGSEVPDPEWQGGLPFRYHVGPGPARLRVQVEDDREAAGGIRAIHDVVARIEGDEWSDEVIVVGAHIDAWGAGATDNVSGTTSVLAAARAIRSLVESGRRPRRTIVVAGWDGEEWGLMGSTEWVERHAARLTSGAVAYLNQDAVGGQRFRAGAAPSLSALIREAARAVPGASGTLYDEWRAGGEGEPGVDDLGGGSDFQPFQHWLGVPSASYGFGSPGGVYHSAYDTHRWMSLYGDPGYENHARTARLTAILALRLANAEVLPYDVRGLAGRLDSLWAPLRAMAVAEAGAPEADLRPLDEALADLGAAGELLDEARRRYLAGPVDPGTSGRANGILIGIQRRLIRPTGPFGDGRVRSLTFASDPRNGYATLALPGVATAIREASRERVRSEIEDLAARLRSAAGDARQAARILDGRSPAGPGTASLTAPTRRADHPPQEVDAW